MDSCRIPIPNRKANRSAKPNSKTNLAGVFVEPNGKYRVVICINYVATYLGIFEDFFEACCVRLSAANKAELGMDAATVRESFKTRRHGMSRTPEYKSWADMKERCFNPKKAYYENYGGRGITVCDRWMTFDKFYADMGDCPPGLTLVRIDVEGNYEPSNCRWTDRFTQNRNTRLRKVNQTGINGVWWDSRRQAFSVSINAEGRVKYLGQSADFFEACCLRRSAELKCFI